MKVMTEIVLGLVPVLFFLAGLVALDTFRLIKFQAVATAIGVGCAAALAAYLVNIAALSALDISVTAYSRYAGPVLEEALKGIFIVYLIRVSKIGFLVDAAILGFSVGAGFALVENIYYLRTLSDAHLLVWIVRGLGTAVMHGGTTAIFAIISKALTDKHEKGSAHLFIPGLAIAVIVHSVYNHFLLPPVYMTVSIMVLLPPLIVAVYYRSERTTREWLGIGLDEDVELLRMIDAGSIDRTRIGQYLQTMLHTFPGLIVGDMLCYLRIYLELSVRAKGILIMQETGFRPKADPEVDRKFEELKYLEKSIGRTGKLALLPLLRIRNRDLWQLHMLKTI